MGQNNLENQLSRLIYCSETIKPLPMDGFMHIRRTTRDNNELNDITGLLAYGEGRFLQILEGSRDIVSETYARILDDPLHHSCCLIQFTSCSERFFDGWTMRHLTVQQDTLEQIGFFERFQPQLWSADRCLSFALKYSVWTGKNEADAHSALTAV
ncbi:hypothetical protein FHS27_000625 [Rhodopirellula rubra]|uniref:BLUF domain-containing protein n=1 Tax=Aporhodopirellula rubra TaxID=980271 RepID=A0A7W5DUM3_9BACT|nr:BLUF domain-containing protein [Aporhodopirellula rubra]MBB3204858.1 hypothetical protein [Aporhodopirellula rubra]